MKKIFTTLLIAILSISVYSQNLNKELLKKVDPKLNYILNINTGLSKTTNLSLPGFVKMDNDVLGVIVKTNNVAELKSHGFNVNSSFGDLATVRIKPDELVKLASLSSVEFISAGRISYPTNSVGGAVVGARLLNSGYVNNTQYKGQGVLLCIIDTGIDWKHLDFRDPSDSTKSRIVYIWDQTLTKTGSEKTPEDRDGTNLSGLNYGVEYTATNINDEIDSSPSGFVREKDINGHGTHVAGTAAGNGTTLTDKKYAGMAPESDLLIIKAGNGSFPNTNLIDALTYAGEIATQLGKAIVVNMSLGGDGGPHDGTTALDQAVDNFTASANGRVCVISAGNSGSSNIHITGSIPSSNTTQFNIIVPSYSPTGGSSNDTFDFDLWFNTNGTVNTTVTTPNSIQVSNSTSTNDGAVFIGNTINANNNNREIEYYIYDQVTTKTPAQGNWKFSVTNTSSSSMIYHGWLTSNSVGGTLTNGDVNYTVGSPGTATNALTVGAFVTRWRWQDVNGSSLGYVGSDRSDNIASFSSIGPRRDGVQKPDIAAPGQAIISARSVDTSPNTQLLINGGKYVVFAGTSMSSPLTAGSVALLLQQKPDLTYAEVKNYITTNSSTDSFTGTVPNNNWGYGKLNIFSAMLDLINPGVEKNFKTFVYDQSVSSAFTNVAPNTKFAVRFSPDFSGQVTGAFLHTYKTSGITGSLSFEIWSDNSGLPGSKLGNTVNYDANSLSLFTWNFIDLQGTNVNVTSGIDYHIVAYFTSGTITGFLLDNGNPDSRTSRDYNDGNGWQLKSTYDFKLRPIVASVNTLVGVEEALSLPLKFELYNNYPNPFNPSTIIKYELPNKGFVKLKIYDVLGREVVTLVNKEQDSGVYQVLFKGENLSSGVYFYRLQVYTPGLADNFVQTKKMILMK